MRLAMKFKNKSFRVPAGFVGIVPLLAVCALLSPLSAAAEGTWTALANSAPGGVETMLLMSDGTVMAQNGGGTGWYKLSPDSSGHYANGTWTTRASMTYSRLYYSSDVLKDGRVFMAGAEYGNGTTNAEIYNSEFDYWSIVPIPDGIINENNTVDPKNGNNSEGFIDSDSVILNNGKVLILPNGTASYGEMVIYDPVANAWSSTDLYQGNNEDEACSVKLPDDSILLVDSGGTTSERYIPSSNTWVNDGTVPVTLYDPYGTEQGPAFLLPNGKAFFIGSAPHTAIYTPSGSTSPGTWAAGPNIPSTLGAPDAPAAMMNNGKILCALSPTPYNLGGTNYVFTSPSYFYEYDYTIGSIGAFTQVHAPGGGYTRNQVTYNDRMLDLPDGTVLFTDGGSQLYVYQPDGSPIASGKPAIYNVSWNTDGSLHVSGTLFNGISQGAAYGDDAQMDSNYPLIRFVDGSGNVYYGRTYNWSSTSVQTGGQIVATECAVPANVFDYPGSFYMQVVANGIASDPVSFFGPVWVDFSYSGFPFQLGWYSYPFNSLAGGVGSVASGGTIIIKSGISHETMTISKPMTITSVYGPSTIGH
jgi:hypothetical protein